MTANFNPTPIKLPAVLRDVCGTITGHARHRSHNEEYCEPCATALREHRRKSYKKWNLTTKEYRDNWYNKNKESIKDKRNVYGREYVKNNPEYYRNKCRRRRAKKRNNGYQSYTESQLIETYKLICYLCNGTIDLSLPRKTGNPGWEFGLHIDHVVPIISGGPDTLENVRPTHAICNLQKGSKMGNIQEEFEPELNADLFEEEDVEYDKHSLDDDLDFEE